MTGAGKVKRALLDHFKQSKPFHDMVNRPLTPQEIQLFSEFHTVIGYKIAPSHYAVS